MASLFILGGTILHERLSEKKEAKRRKAAEDQRKLEELRRLQESHDRKAKNAAVERDYDSGRESEGDEPLPRYEDVVNNSSGGNAGSSSQAGGAGSRSTP